MGLLEKIKAGCQATKEIDWPGLEDAKVKLRICSENDNLQATIETDKLFAGTKIAVENVDAYSAERETQLLFRILLDPETGQSLFKNITEFRSILTPEIKNILADELDALHEEFSPDPETIPEDEFDKLVQDVKKNAEVINTLSSIYMLRRLARFLANQL